METIHLKLEPVIEPKTAGRTDSEIKSQSWESLEAQTVSARKCIEVLEEQLRGEKNRLFDLERLAIRKQELQGKK